MLDLKARPQVATMREAGRLVARVLAALAEQARPGVRLIELDAVAAEMLAAAGAQSSFRDYHPSWAPRPYPGVVCLSVNDVIVHGIPDHRALRDGDVLSIDFGAAINGLHADAAISMVVGAGDAAAQRLVDSTSRALAAGIAAAQVGATLGDIGHAVEQVARAEGYGIPPFLGGHGIGRAMHEAPFVPNSGMPGKGLRLREGLVLAIEPMLLEGRHDGQRTLPDGWAVATSDRSRAAHFEHTVAITVDGPRVLTEP